MKAAIEDLKMPNGVQRHQILWQAVHQGMTVQARSTV